MNSRFLQWSVLKIALGFESPASVHSACTAPLPSVAGFGEAERGERRPANFSSLTLMLTYIVHSGPETLPDSVPWCFWVGEGQAGVLVPVLQGLSPQWPSMPNWEHRLTCHGDPGERAPGRDLSAVSHQDGLAQTVRNEILKSSTDRRRGVRSQG